MVSQGSLYSSSTKNRVNQHRVCKWYFAGVSYWDRRAPARNQWNRVTSLPADSVLHVPDDSIALVITWGCGVSVALNRITARVCICVRNLGQRTAWNSACAKRWGTHPGRGLRMSRCWPLTRRAVFSPTASVYFALGLYSRLAGGRSGVGLTAPAWYESPYQNVSGYICRLGTRSPLDGSARRRGLLDWCACLGAVQG